MKFRISQQFVLAQDVRVTWLHGITRAGLGKETLPSGTLISDWFSVREEVEDGFVRDHCFLASFDDGETWYLYTAEIRENGGKILTTVDPVEKRVKDYFFDDLVRYYLPKTAKAKAQ